MGHALEPQAAVPARWEEVLVRCKECGGKLDLFVVGICPQCSYDLTGDDPERDERERRDTLGGAESPQEATEA